LSPPTLIAFARPSHLLLLLLLEEEVLLLLDNDKKKEVLEEGCTNGTIETDKWKKKGETGRKFE
jgi:hypothetical protein